MKWSQCYVENKTGLKDLGLAFHTMCAVFHKNRTKIRLYRKLELLTLTKNESNLPFEGVFVFGGQYKDGTCCNNLKILKID